jgi:hypothetical protein
VDLGKLVSPTLVAQKFPALGIFTEICAGCATSAAKAQLAAQLAAAFVATFIGQTSLVSARPRGSRVPLLSARIMVRDSIGATVGALLVPVAHRVFGQPQGPQRAAAPLVLWSGRTVSPVDGLQTVRHDQDNIEAGAYRRQTWGYMISS